MARTDTLGHFLTDVADAIREKKGTSETIQASDFDTEIENLPSGGDLSEYLTDTITANYTKYSFLKKEPPIDVVVANNVTTLSGLFSGLQQSVLPRVVCNDNVTSMSQMYSSNQSIKKINLSGLNTSNVTNMSGMFNLCQRIEEIDFSNFDTSKVTDMSQMFSQFARNTNNKDFSLDLSSFYTTSLTNTSSMFSYAEGIRHLDIRNFTFDSITNFNNMFGNNTSSSSGPPNSCEIIVKSQTEKDWFTTNYSRFTNVKTVAEYEAEQSE